MKETNNIFKSFDVLVPKEEFETYWPVIACDQFTSQPEYWKKLRKAIGDKPSTIHCIIPEAELSQAAEKTYSDIRETMQSYLSGSIFREYKDSFVYVERQLPNGDVRQGIVGVIDLEAYDYHTGSSSPIRATERTVLERIPPRVKIRKSALLELSHVLLLCGDSKFSIIEPLQSQATTKLYDIDLLQGGGHVTGWLVDGVLAEQLRARLEEYCEKPRFSGMLFAVGDGNHSLAAAKAHYEELKNTDQNPDVIERARYAMVELENIYSPIQKLEPIHRLLTGVYPAGVLSFLERNCCHDGTTDNEYIIEWVSGNLSGRLHLKNENDDIPVYILQKALDEYFKTEPGELDYIHGENTLRKLADRPDAIGFILPKLTKDNFFKTIAQDGSLPRKTFSIGKAKDKRYYIETRQL